MVDKNHKITLEEYGCTSTTFYVNGLFFKFLVMWGDCDVYKREKYLASILKQFDWFPTLLFSYDEKRLLIYKKCGVRINKDNCPKDINSQLDKILKDLQSVNIQHNDIKREEILVDSNGKVYLCDFGWGSINNSLNCGIDIWGGSNKKKPGGWLEDESTICSYKSLFSSWIK